MKNNRLTSLYRTPLSLHSVAVAAAGICIILIMFLFYRSSTVLFPLISLPATLVIGWMFGGIAGLAFGSILLVTSVLLFAGILPALFPGMWCDIPVCLFAMAAGYAAGRVRDRLVNTRQQIGSLIQEKKELEQKVQEIEKKAMEAENAKDFMEKFINCIADPVFIKDREHRWILMNDAHSAFMGYTTGELIGKSDYDFFPEYQANIFWEKDELVFETGEENINEEEFTDSEGNVHIIQTKKTLHTDLKGDKFIVGVFTDITERIRNEERIRQINTELEQRVAERTEELTQANAQLNEDIRRREIIEKALAEEKERLAVTLRSIGDGVIAVDTSARIVLMNREAERLTGWNFEEAESRNISEVFVIMNESTRQHCPDPLGKVLQNGESVDADPDTILISKDGKEMSLTESGAPIRDSARNIIGGVLVFRDVTEKKRLEEKLANTQKLESVGILAGGIAHDFNNLLTGIFGFISIAKDSLPDESEAVEMLSRSMNVLNRAKDLTRQLLTFSKGGHPVKTITSLVETLKENVQFVLSGKNVDCVFDIPDDLWKCNVDVNQIAQAVDNIVINAQQAMAYSGTITVKAQNTVLDSSKKIPLKDGNYVVISVTDQGHGIQESVINKIFDPFFSTKSGGSGLGLATTHSIIKKHDGCIDVDSVPGKGTTFRIYLPAADMRYQQAEKNTLLPQKKTVTERKPGRILVVDDEDFILNVVRSQLSRIGYVSTVVNNGRDAVSIYREAMENSEPFDLVILDMTMPGGMNGIETSALLHEVDPEVKVIASSGYFDESESADRGFVGTLSKPYTMSDLSRALSKYLV